MDRPFPFSCSETKSTKNDAFQEKQRNSGVDAECLLIRIKCRIWKRLRNLLPMSTKLFKKLLDWHSTMKTTRDGRNHNFLYRQQMRLWICGFQTNPRKKRAVDTFREICVRFVGLCVVVGLPIRIHLVKDFLDLPSLLLSGLHPAVPEALRAE